VLATNPQILLSRGVVLSQCFPSSLISYCPDKCVHAHTDRTDCSTRTTKVAGESLDRPLLRIRRRLHPCPAVAASVSLDLCSCVGGVCYGCRSGRPAWLVRRSAPSIINVHDQITLRTARFD